MPVLPKDDTPGTRTRSQGRQLEAAQRREGPSQAVQQEQQAAESTATGDARNAPPVNPQVPATMDVAAVMALLQGLERRQEEARRRQEERQEEARRRQEERQEEQARQLQEQLKHDKEEQTHLLKELNVNIGKELTAIREKVQHQEDRIIGVENQIVTMENRFDKNEAQMAAMKKTLGDLKSGEGIVAPVVTSSSMRGFKVPPFDGSSSWTAYKVQFEAVVKANGWNDAQAMTALTLGLRDQALTILEAVGKDVTYEQLLEALESRYGDAHLEHVFRAQLKDRAQRSGENLQQWALEIEKLVRKAYQSAPTFIAGYLVQAFIDGIRDLEIRAAVRLGHHESLKDALAHALEVEAARQDQRSHHIRKVLTPIRDSRPKFSPRCFHCGEKGHLKFNCPDRVSRDGTNIKARATWRVADDFKGAPRLLNSQAYDRGKSHGNADALSRRSCSDDYKHCARKEMKETVPIRMLRTNDWKEALRTAQRKDLDIRPIKEKMKTRCNKYLSSPGFSEGSLVWLHNPVRKKGISPKLQARWDGPYRIVTRINDVTYRIQKGPRGAPKVVHVNRLARYHESNNARDEHV